MTPRERVLVVVALFLGAIAVGVLLPAGGGYTVLAFLLAVVALDVAAPLLDGDPAVVVRDVTVDEACAAVEAHRG